MTMAVVRVVVVVVQEEVIVIITMGEGRNGREGEGDIRGEVMIVHQVTTLTRMERRRVWGTQTSSSRERRVRMMRMGSSG
jgi:hypothetical protein